MALKVYRTPIGFHDAYVAASSQKAALEAWGADANLFARGVAEVVTDSALTAAPLEAPGVVIKRLRGTVAEQLAAAPGPAKIAKPAPAKPKTAPRPVRDEVDRAEAALAEAEVLHRQAEQALAEEEAALAGRRRAGRAAWLAERAELEGERDAAEDRYAAALKHWQAAQD